MNYNMQATQVSIATVLYSKNYSCYFTNAKKVHDVCTVSINWFTGLNIYLQQLLLFICLWMNVQGYKDITV